MGIRFTDTDNIAMYDSTTGWAFGPIFASEFDAGQFSNWASAEHGVHDFRRIDEKLLRDMFNEWSRINWQKYDPEDRPNHAPHDRIY